jgi:hypothetical protein
MSRPVLAGSPIMGDESKEETNKVIPAGSLFVLTTHRYSDHTVKGAFRAQRDIDPDKLVELYLQKYPDARSNFNETRFFDELVADGFFVTIPSVEWNIDPDRSVPENTVEPNNPPWRDSARSVFTRRA